MEAQQAAGSDDRRKGLNHSVEKAMAILSAFDPEHPHWGVNELARQLGLSRSAVSRLLASLEVCGFVVQDSRTGRFRLGVSALELAFAYFQTNDLVLRAAPYLADLARRLEMHTHLYGLSDGRMFRYFMVQYPTGLGMLAGFRALAHATAAGKVLLAHLPPEELMEVIARHGLPAATSHTIVDADQLCAHLAEVRLQGYALDDEESKIGTRCVAVPVRDTTARVVAAASISTQRNRLPDDQVPYVRDQLLEAVSQISPTLSHEAARPGARTVRRDK